MKNVDMRLNGDTLVITVDLEGFRGVEIRGVAHDRLHRGKYRGAGA